MKSIVLSMIVSIALLSCKSKNTSSDNESYDVACLDLSFPAALEKSAPPSTETVKFVAPNINDNETEVNPVSIPTVSKKKIIKDGHITIKAKEVTASKKEIDAIAKNLNAYYEVEDLTNNDLEMSYDLKIRVPSHNFEKLIAAVESGTDEITSKSIQARDVTEEFMDL